MGVRLFNRTNRSIHITDAGEHLLGRIAPALGDITEAVEHIGAFRGRPAGSLRLNVPRNAAEIVIRPMTGRFLEAYPEIRLEVVTQDGLVDIVSEGFDAGIRAGQDLGLDMISVPIGPALRFAVVGSPSYFANRDKPAVPQDLRTHACVGRRYPSGALYTWAFARGSEAIDIAIRGRLVVDDRSLIIGAALDGVAAGPYPRSPCGRSYRTGRIGARTRGLVPTATTLLPLLPRPTAGASAPAGIHGNGLRKERPTANMKVRQPDKDQPLLLTSNALQPAS